MLWLAERSWRGTTECLPTPRRQQAGVAGMFSPFSWDNLSGSRLLPWGGQGTGMVGVGQAVVVSVSGVSGVSGIFRNMFHVWVSGVLLFQVLQPCLSVELVVGEPELGNSGRSGKGSQNQNWAQAGGWAGGHPTMSPPVALFWGSDVQVHTGQKVGGVRIKGKKQKQGFVMNNCPACLSQVMG